MPRLLLLFAFVSVCFCQAPVLRREGPYFVQTLSGPIPPGEQLRVSFRGNTTLRGVAPGEPAGYVLRKRVRARDEAEAIRLLQGILIRTTRQRIWTSLTLVNPDRPGVTAELDLRAPKTLRQVIVATGIGDVQIFDIDGTAEAETGGGMIQMDRIGGNVVASTGGGEIQFGRVLGSVKVISAGGSIHVDYAGGESSFETAGGEIYVRETGGPMRASTGGGNIRVEKAAATVAAHTASGRIDVQKAVGAVTAGNKGGSIQVGAANGVQCDATGGTIRLRGTSGSLRAVMDVGSILAELIPGVPLKDSVLSTGSGDITVLIPSNLAVTVKARNQSNRSGRIVSDFTEIPVRIGTVAASRGSLAEGVLNGGGPLLQISAAGGTIYLRRMK